MRLRYGKGKGSVEVTGELKTLILKGLRNTDQILLDSIEKHLSKIEEAAKKEWPVRQKKYWKSEDSKHKFSKGFRVIPPSTVEGFIRNMAPYAFAIKAGRGSSTSVKEGKRVAEELVFKPTREAAQALVEEIANALMKELK